MFGSRRKTPKLIWSETPWSTSETAKIFIKLLNQEPFYLRTLTDVDNFSDIKNLIDEMPQEISVSQAEILSWIRKIT